MFKKRPPSPILALFQRGSKTAPGGSNPPTPCQFLPWYHSRPSQFWFWFPCPKFLYVCHSAPASETMKAKGIDFTPTDAIMWEFPILKPTATQNPSFSRKTAIWWWNLQKPQFPEWGLKLPKTWKLSRFEEHIHLKCCFITSIHTPQTLLSYNSRVPEQAVFNADVSSQQTDRHSLKSVSDFHQGKLCLVIPECLQQMPRRQMMPTKPRISFPNALRSPLWPGSDAWNHCASEGRTLSNSLKSDFHQLIETLLTSRLTMQYEVCKYIITLQPHL